MHEHRELRVPDRLEEVCNPEQLALVVYDMQVGIIGQLNDGPQVTAQVVAVLEAARRADIRVFFTRYMTLPKELMGISQLRTAMTWQKKEAVEDVVSPFL